MTTRASTNGQAAAAQQIKSEFQYVIGLIQTVQRWINLLPGLFTARSARERTQPPGYCIQVLLTAAEGRTDDKHLKVGG